MEDMKHQCPLSLFPSPWIRQHDEGPTSSTPPGKCFIITPLLRDMVIPRLFLGRARLGKETGSNGARTREETNERVARAGIDGVLARWLWLRAAHQTQARAAAAHRSNVRLVALTSALPLPLLPTSVPPM